MARLREEDEKARNIRRLKWRDISLALSRLPPRMEEWYTSMVERSYITRKGEMIKHLTRKIN